MDLFTTLTDDNIELFAAKYYYNPRCTHIDEFYEDLKRFKYIKRLVNRYQETGKLSERLILNHLIVVFNVFGIEASLRILESRLNENQWGIVKPFLILLKAVENTQYVGVEMDNVVVEALRKI